MIDKEKLLKEIACDGLGDKCEKCKHFYPNMDTIGECIMSIIKNFPEEPDQPIDFDALWNEYNITKCVGNTCDECEYSGVSDEPGACFAQFLKSKNLTALKPVFDIPVKRTWTMKKEYVDFCKTFGIDLAWKVVKDEDLQYYDLHEEPDYSKIPKGSIVEVTLNNAVQTKLYDKVERVVGDQLWLCNHSNIVFTSIKNVRIVELAKE